MFSKFIARIGGAVLAVSLSGSAWAGGGAHGGGGHGAGMMFYPHGGGAFAGGGRHGGGAFQGGGRFRVGGGASAGSRSYAFGHTGTAQRTGFSTGMVNGFRTRGGYGYGHVATEWRGGRGGFGRVRTARRFGFRGWRVGQYGDDGYGGDFAGASGYGGNSGSVYVLGGAQSDAGTTQTGGGPAGYGFAEPPLNAISYGGGPQILTVGGRTRRGADCSCAWRGDVGPVVYRFGVGSYY